ncbi:MAG TPA: histidine triad nucleotide-binding protein [Acidimicrobiales bacterium]|nr:histidine triad nucleotide-binding protein [Acidimicrobiales bacterium]
MTQAGAEGTGPTDCLFCRIVRRELPAEIVEENELALAFRDIAPVAPTHVLVVPRAHVRDASVLDREHGPLLAELAATARRVAEREGVAASGYRLVFNVGEDASNSVPHLHLHVIGGRRLGWPPG